jgi:hypothetical protein
MSWRCPKCGEIAEDQFDACWSCGAINPGGARRESDITAAAAVLEESEDQDLRLANDQLVQTIDQAAREQAITAGLVTPEQRQAARAGHELARLVKAWRQYRSRIEHPSRGQRPDLDRRWTYLYLSAAILVGGAAAMLVYPDDVWPSWLRESGIYLYLGTLVVNAICWRRAVRGELGDA